MTDFKDRESAFENKFALDEALLFKAEARCCKLFGLWMAEQLEFRSK
ncbi:MAG: ATPase inhibitor subunit zeta [Alphaproteobacteria bacterium]